MSKSTKKDEPGRRRFLKDGMAAALAAGCLTTAGVNEARAADQKQTKPPLTNESFNARIPPPRNAEAFRRVVEEMKGGLVSYLFTHFHLTAEEGVRARSLTRENLQEFNNALDEAVKRRLKITLVLQCAATDKINLKTRLTPNTLLLTVESR